MGVEKIVKIEDFPEIRKVIKEQGKRIVMCHGVFDLLHLGHVEHLIDAKKQGDVLVVSVTAAKYVNKGVGRPVFSDAQRLEFLSNLEVVDYCMLSEAVTAHDMIRIVRPDVYAKGREYQDERNDITGNIGGEESCVIENGGVVYYTEGDVFSSTKLLNRFFSALPEGVLQASLDMKAKLGEDLMESIRSWVESFRDLKVLVVGDVILDEYVFCNIQGVTMKDASISAFYENEERYTGGALAVAKHIAGFSDNVTLCSMTGTEHGVYDFIIDNMKGVKLELITDSSFTTPVKRRFLKTNSQRHEYDKLFSVNRLMKRGERKRFDYGSFHRRLEEITGNYDLVVVADFGHGLIDDEAIRILETKAEYLSVNCQSNSANMGTNIITKYSRADIFVVDERELRLAFGQALEQREALLERLKERLNASYAWTTVGAEGAIGAFDRVITHQPALTLSTTDTVGAGDAFYSLAALCAYKRLPVEAATLVANAAGALKTGILGNKEPVKKVDLLKFVNTVLNV